MAIRQTHTYATLEVSEACWNEVAAKLREADYGHVFCGPDNGEIDMHGIALVKPAVQNRPDGR